MRISNNRADGIYEFFQIWMNKKTGRVTIMEGDDYDILKRSQFCLYIPDFKTLKLVMSLTPWYFREGLR